MRWCASLKGEAGSQLLPNAEGSNRGPQFTFRCKKGITKGITGRLKLGEELDGFSRKSLILSNFG